MRLGRRITWKPLLPALLVAALAVAPALGAPGRRLDKSGDSGYPSVFVTGGAQSPRKIIIRVRTEPNAKVEVRWDISCAIGGKGRFRIGEFDMSGRSQRRIKLSMKRPDECIANALVSFDDSGQTGKLRAELFARER